jgi:AcrR family transcriptional regulator
MAAKAKTAAAAKAAGRKASRDKSAIGAGGSTGRATGWQAEKSAMTRNAILEAAIQCFVDQGYTKTTTAMIAAEAGVSRGAMMHHFPSRSAVMQAVVAYLHDRRISEYRELMAGIDLQEDELTRADIRKSVQAAWDYVNLPSFIAYQELNAAARTDAELSDVIEAVERDFERQFLRTVKAVFPHWKRLKSLQAAHDLVQFVMNGMATSYRLSNRRRRADRVIDLVTDQLVRIYEIERSD